MSVYDVLAVDHLTSLQKQRDRKSATQQLRDHRRRVNLSYVKSLPATPKVSRKSSPDTLRKSMARHQESLSRAGSPFGSSTRLDASSYHPASDLGPTASSNRNNDDILRSSHRSNDDITRSSHRSNDDISRSSHRNNDDISRSSDRNNDDLPRSSSYNQHINKRFERTRFISLREQTPYLDRHTSKTNERDSPSRTKNRLAVTTIPSQSTSSHDSTSYLSLVSHTGLYRSNTLQPDRRPLHKSKSSKTAFGHSPLGSQEDNRHKTPYSSDENVDLISTNYPYTGHMYTSSHTLPRNYRVNSIISPSCESREALLGRYPSLNSSRGVTPSRPVSPGRLSRGVTPTISSRPVSPGSSSRGGTPCSSRGVTPITTRSSRHSSPFSDSSYRISARTSRRTSPTNLDVSTAYPTISSVGFSGRTTPIRTISPTSSLRSSRRSSPINSIISNTRSSPVTRKTSPSTSMRSSRAVSPSNSMGRTTPIRTISPTSSLRSSRRSSPLNSIISNTRSSPVTRKTSPSTSMRSSRAVSPSNSITSSRRTSPLISAIELKNKVELDYYSLCQDGISLTSSLTPKNSIESSRGTSPDKSIVSPHLFSDSESLTKISSEDKSLRSSEDKSSFIISSEDTSLFRISSPIELLEKSTIQKTPVILSPVKSGQQTFPESGQQTSPVAIKSNERTSPIESITSLEFNESSSQTISRRNSPVVLMSSKPSEITSPVREKVASPELLEFSDQTTSTRNSPIAIKSAKSSKRTSPVREQITSPSLLGSSNRTSPVKVTSSRPSRRTSPVKLSSARSSRRTSPVKLKSARSSRRTSPVKLTSSSSSRRTSPVTLNSSRPSRRTSPVTLKSSRSSRRTSPVTLNSSRSSRRTSPVHDSQITYQSGSTRSSRRASPENFHSDSSGFRNQSSASNRNFSPNNPHSVRSSRRSSPIRPNKKAYPTVTRELAANSKIPRISSEFIDKLSKDVADEMEDNLSLSGSISLLDTQKSVHSDSGIGEELVLSGDEKPVKKFNYDFSNIDRNQLEKLLKSVTYKKEEHAEEGDEASFPLENSLVKDMSPAVEEAPDLVRRQSVIIQGLVMETEELRDKVATLEDELASVPFIDELQEKLDNFERKLDDSESYVYQLLEENIDMKTEMETLEVEISEAQDHFRDNDAREFKKTKWELETMSKSIRNLQLKLKKAQLKAALLRQEKEELEDSQREGAMWRGAAIIGAVVVATLWKLKS